MFRFCGKPKLTIVLAAKTDRHFLVPTENRLSRHLARWRCSAKRAGAGMGVGRGASAAVAPTGGNLTFGIPGTVRSTGREWDASFGPARRIGEAVGVAGTNIFPARGLCSLTGPGTGCYRESGGGVVPVGELAPAEGFGRRRAWLAGEVLSWPDGSGEPIRNPCANGNDWTPVVPQ